MRSLFSDISDRQRRGSFYGFWSGWKLSMFGLECRGWDRKNLQNLRPQSRGPVEPHTAVLITYKSLPEITGVWYLREGLAVCLVKLIGAYCVEIWRTTGNVSGLTYWLVMPEIHWIQYLLNLKRDGDCSLIFQEKPEGICDMTKKHLWGFNTNWFHFESTELPSQKNSYV